MVRSRRASRKRRRKPQRTVRSELTRLLRAHAITPANYQQDNASFNAALAAERHLTGTRRAELTSVTETLHQIAAARGLIPSRLPALFQTLDRNRQWWTSGPLLASGQRVEFAGSQLVWEYYPGQGIQLQVLGTFGKANGLYESGAGGYGALQRTAGRDDPARGPAGRRPGLGVLLPLRRRQPPVDERDVAGDRAAGPLAMPTWPPTTPTTFRSPRRRCRCSALRHRPACGSGPRWARATSSTRSPPRSRSSTPSCRR